MPRLVALSALAFVPLVAVAVALAQPAPPPPEPSPTPRLNPQDRARRSKVIAKVGTASITIGMVEDEVNAQSPFLRARYQEPEKLQEFVNNMIRFELLAIEAARRELDRDTATVQVVKQHAVQQLMRTQFDERITPQSVPAADVRAYFTEHPQEFNRPEMVRASHILVQSREDAASVLVQARDVDARGFRELARDRSIDNETKLRGGDLRYFMRDGHGPNPQDAAVDSALVRAAFALRDVGDVVTAPVQVGEQWSIVKLTGRRPADHQAFEVAEQSIRLRLWRERRQQAVEDFVTELRQRYNPVVHEERMAPIHLEVPAPGANPHSSDEHGSPRPSPPTLPMIPGMPTRPLPQLPPPAPPNPSQ